MPWRRSITTTRSSERRRRRCSVVVALLAGCAGPGVRLGAAPTLAEYHASFRRAAGDRVATVAPRAAVLDSIVARRLLWLGDRHDDPALHVLQRALLHELVARGQRPALGLEAIGTVDEADVDSFLRGELSTAELLARITRRWPQSWFADPELDAAHYLALLEFARTHRLPVFALEPTPRLPLPARDPRIAASVRAAARRHAGRPLVVVVGQAHLLGIGDLVGRVELPSTVIGAEPNPELRDTVPAILPPGAFVQSDTGVWWFAELCGGRR